MLRSIFSWFTKPQAAQKFDHHINADVSVVPIGIGTSISKEVSKAGGILKRSGFTEVKPHGFGTNVSGDWSKLIHASEKIAETLINDGVPRLSLNLKVSFRPDKKQQSIGARLAKV